MSSLIRKTLVCFALVGISGAALAQQSADVKKDVFGRPEVAQSADQVEYQANPFAPLPQFWGRDSNGVTPGNHVAAAPHASQSTGS